ncbi:MAG: dual-specificity RNA methyltransferase RlmN [Planctomycetota bacterium]|jgi:23S rRNA (adenine2503-C2)-methyltransferase
MNTNQQHLLGTTIDDFAAFCAEHQLPKYRTKQVFEWVYHKMAGDFADMTNLAKPLREMLAQHWAIHTGTEIRCQNSGDGTVKLLLQWPDQATSECVLIPDDERHTACISSQVGCPIGCQFCASGLEGLQRQLSTGQIVEQAMAIRHLCQPQQRLNNIVIMGTGEPLANYQAVIKAIQIINADWGMNIGARKITLSTVGLPKQIRRLAKEKLQINLAISLHAPNDTIRQKLIPWAKKISIEELVAAGRYFFDTTGREVTIEYILIEDVNDQPEHAYQLVKICRKMRSNLNLIRYNPVPGLPFNRPSSFATHQFAERLRSRGVNAHIRKSRGLDINAACGQLRRSSTG